MDEILKKVQKIDEKGINDNDLSLDKSIEDYKKIINTMKSFNETEDNITYSTNIEKFNYDCLSFIEYVKKCIIDDDFYLLYMLREENIIIYGKYEHGMKKDRHTIEMVSNDDLKKLYQLLQSEFSTDFYHGCKHTFGEGWSLNPTIGENVMIEINSDINSDRNWIYEESHNEQGIELKSKK